MFTIYGMEVFTEADMYIGEKLEETLKNEGFDVKKEYIIQNPAKLVLQFGVEKTNNSKPDSLFNLE